MDVMEAIKARRSVRKFEDKPVRFTFKGGNAGAFRL